MQLADLEGGPLRHVLRDASQVQEYQLDRGVETGHVIHGGDAAVGVQLRFFEPEQFGHAVPVDGESGRGDRRRPHWAEIESVGSQVQALRVPQEALDDRRKIVAKGRRLRRLPVRVGDDKRVALATGLRDQRVGEMQDLFHEASGLLAKSHPEHGVVHVVARTRHVQHPAQFADPPFKLGFKQEKVVLVLPGVGQGFGVHVLLDIPQGRGDRSRLVPRDDPGLEKHYQVRPVDRVHVTREMRPHAVE